MSTSESKKTDQINQSKEKYRELKKKYKKEKY